MEREVIGNKDVFAIEFVIDHSYTKNQIVYGGCRLWLREQYLGDINDYIYLNMFCKSLKRVGNLNKHWTVKVVDEIPNNPKSIKEIRYLIEKEIGIQIFSGENFDKFSKLCLRNDESLIFYWCLNTNVSDNPKVFPQFVDFPKEVQVAEILISEINEVAHLFEARINKIIEESPNIEYE
jgi:hypothetical protein